MLLVARLAVSSGFARTSVEFAVVRYHKHDFPLKDICVNESAGYAWDVLVGLHLFKLPAQEPGRRRTRHGRERELGPASRTQAQDRQNLVHSCFEWIIN